MPAGYQPADATAAVAPAPVASVSSTQMGIGAALLLGVGFLIYKLVSKKGKGKKGK